MKIHVNNMCVCVGGGGVLVWGKNKCEAEMLSFNNLDTFFHIFARETFLQIFDSDFLEK